MKLNCRPGDLAIVIKSLTAKHVGDLVNVIRLMPCDGSGPPSWEIEPLSKRLPGDGFTMWVAYDDQLRPIRDQPGEDETLQWAGLPQGVGVAA